MFTEGGNYGHEEAMVVVNTLNNLSSIMLDERIETLESLRPIGYGSLVEIKETLSKQMKPYAIFCIDKFLISILRRLIEYFCRFIDFTSILID